MIFTDGIHLITNNDIDELHAFAEKIGLKREWFQDKRNPHYDIMGKMVKLARKNGAILVDSRTLIIIFKIKKDDKKIQDKNPVAFQEGREYGLSDRYAINKNPYNSRTDKGKWMSWNQGFNGSHPLPRPIEVQGKLF